MIVFNTRHCLWLVKTLPGIQDSHLVRKQLYNNSALLGGDNRGSVLVQDLVNLGAIIVQTYFLFLLLVLDHYGFLVRGAGIK